MATAGLKKNGHTDQSGLGLGDLDSIAFDGFSDQDFGGFNFDDLGLTSVQPDHLGGEDPLYGSQGLDFELNNAEESIIRIAKGKFAGSGGHAATAKSEKVYITHEDFDEGPERDAFLLIYGYAEHLFDCPATAAFDRLNPKMMKAIEFFFCSNSLKSISLDDAVACIDNQIRVDVLRLRFMLEFWIRGWELPPMPDAADPLPGRVELMAAQFGGLVGISIAKEAWFEPGITAAALLEKVIDGRSDNIVEIIKKSFSDLVCAYVISIDKGRVYTTGKNPILELEDMRNDPTVRLRGILAGICWSRRF